ncbi:MAG: hypothetical protein KF773_14600 [Deltaproteobacteria bacterium]|nr:hypothetical protein [Deltaproteobacteria bacterium]
MDDAELAAEVDDALRLRHAIACELGTFFVWQSVRPRRRTPVFLPSDRLLDRVAPGGTREADYVRYLEQATLGTVDLTFGRPLTGDPSDPKPPIPFPQTIARSVQIGKLFAEVAASLAVIGRIEIAGLGTFRRVRIGRTPTDVVTFEPAPRLRDAVNATPPAPRG